MFIDVKHPGDQLLTVTVSFSEKNGKLVIPCAFSGISISPLLSTHQRARPVGKV